MRNRHRHIEHCYQFGARCGFNDRPVSTQANTYILIGSEVLKVTAVSTNTLTVIRGQDGTTATTHLDAAKVFLLKEQCENSEGALRTTTSGDNY